MSDPGDAYRKIFEHSPDAILIIEGDRFVDCNPAAARMMRFPSKQALLERYSGGEADGSLRAHPAEFSPPTQSDGRDSFEKARSCYGSRSSAAVTSSSGTTCAPTGRCSPSMYR